MPQDADEGQAWEVDVAISCTDGRWSNGVSAIVINGRLLVDADGNITVPEVPALVSAAPGRRCCVLARWFARACCWCVDTAGAYAYPPCSLPHLMQGVELVVTDPAEPDSPLAQRGQNVTAAYALNYVNGTFIESDDEFAFVLGEGHGECNLEKVGSAVQDLVCSFTCSAGLQSQASPCHHNPCCSHSWLGRADSADACGRAGHAGGAPWFCVCCTHRRLVAAQQHADFRRNGALCRASGLKASLLMLAHHLPAVSCVKTSFIHGLVQFQHVAAVVVAACVGPW